MIVVADCGGGGGGDMSVERHFVWPLSNLIPGDIPGVIPIPNAGVHHRRSYDFADTIRGHTLDNTVMVDANHV